MTIYSEVNTPRLAYIVRFLADFFNSPVLLTHTPPSDASFFVNYSATPLPNSIQMVPHSILFEQSIAPQSVQMEAWNGAPCFFKTQQGSNADFDLLAATFYLISRYEEYLPFNADEHLRFPATESVAFREDFLHLPVVDEWWLSFARIYQNAGGEIKINRHYAFIQTVDIDKAYAYKHQAFPYNLLLFGKALAQGKGAEYLWTLENKRKDPFDVYDLMEKVHDASHVKSIFFILSGKRGPHDKNIPVHTGPMRKLLARVNAKSTLGLHPSYASYLNKKTLAQELANLQHASGIGITKSRQHYLRFKLPETFQQLEKIGIKEEYSMGYADQPGFRAGTCTPFMFYNLEKEQETALKIFPLILMDVTLSRYLHLSPGAAVQKSKALIAAVKRVNGCFISLWHNSSFCALHNMEGWEYVFKEMVKFAAEHD